MSHSACDSRRIFVQKTLVHVVRYTFRTATQAFGAFGLPIYRVAFDLVSLAFGTCYGVSLQCGGYCRITAYRLGSWACAAEGWDAFHPHDLRPHLVASVATSRGHQAFQYLMKATFPDRQGIRTQVQMQVEVQTQMPCDCQRTRHHPPIGNCNGRGLSAYCLGRCRVVDAGVDS